MRALAALTFASTILNLALAGCATGSFAPPRNSLASSPSPSLRTGSARLSAQSKSPIAHVVLIVQENRSFDNLFALFPGADGATRGKEKIKQGNGYVDKWVTLTQHSLIMKEDVAHCHASFETSYDDGKMDGFNLVPVSACSKDGKPAGTLVYQYVQRSLIKPYWDMAQRWILADHMFQTQGSGSFTAHQDLIRRRHRNRRFQEPHRFARRLAVGLRRATPRRDEDNLPARLRRLEWSLPVLEQVSKLFLGWIRDAARPARRGRPILEVLHALLQQL